MKLHFTDPSSQDAVNDQGMVHEDDASEKAVNEVACDQTRESVSHRFGDGLLQGHCIRKEWSIHPQLFNYHSARADFCRVPTTSMMLLNWLSPSHSSCA